MVLILSVTACKTYKPVSGFNELPVSPVDYRDLNHWAAHPDKDDPSDNTPERIYPVQKNADVFFLHPTTYIGEKGEDQWNASITDEKLNRKTDDGTILFQASAFNHAGRVYAPRYRQAHLDVYFTKDTISALKAFDLAYQDVRNAFEVYLKDYNQGRPIVIASHSQGTNHAERLINEYFNGKRLQKQLVAAYLIGMPVAKDRFQFIAPCRDSLDTNCFISWRTFKHGHEFYKDGKGDSISVTNPLSWTTTEEFVPKSKSKGSLLRDFNKIYHELVDAQVHNGILWANKPKFKGSFFLRTKNYHVADINFYYFNIRQNAAQRVDAFIQKRNISDD